MCKLSIVVPTRNRPEQLEMLLSSLALQENNNFEVIVSDNSDSSTQEGLVKSYKKDHFRYIRPEKMLGMCDHWDFAISYAKGEYVTILIDKYILFPSAVNQIIAELTKNQDLDILSWLYEGVIPENPSNFTDMKNHKVSYKPEYLSGNPLVFDAKEELHRRRLNSSAHRSAHGPLYFRGKICSGVYSRSLLNKIISIYGRIFPPASPDFTSCTLALSIASHCRDMNKVIGQFGGYDGNGAKGSSHINFLIEFLKDNNCFIDFEKLPIPGLYASGDNWVGLDLYVDQSILAQSRPNYEDFGWLNLFKNIRISVDAMRFNDDGEKESQLKLLYSAEESYFCGQSLSCMVNAPGYIEEGDLIKPKLQTTNDHNNLWRLVKETIKKLPFAIPLYEYWRKRYSKSVLWVNRMEAYEIGSKFHQSNELWSVFRDRYAKSTVKS